MNGDGGKSSELGSDDSPVLVVVVNSPADFDRVRTERWYRIPLARAPRRVAAEHLAFYLTGAFPPAERWRVGWVAPVQGYHIVKRKDLLPDETGHPRANEQYYKVALGDVSALPVPIPSRRLRRITFIPTTLERLHRANEINDLWIKSTAQERLWAALKAADLDAERQYPLREDLPQYVADFALFGRRGRVALLVEDEPCSDAEMREALPPDYLLAAGGWTTLRSRREELQSDPEGWVQRLANQIDELGGPAC